MKCPNCGLINPDSALRCDCGYDFSKQMKESYVAAASAARAANEGQAADEAPPSPPLSDESVQAPRRIARRTKLPEAAGVMYVLFGVYLLLISVLQVLSGAGVWPDAAEPPNGVWSVLFPGVWNLGVSVIFFVIARALFRRSRRGYDWGLGTSLLNIPLGLLTGGLNCITVPISIAYAFTAVILWKARDEFGKPETSAPVVSLTSSTSSDASSETVPVHADEGRTPSRLRLPAPTTPTGIISGLLVAAIGLLYLLSGLAQGANPAPGTEWISIVCLSTGVLCFIVAVGIALEQRWGRNAFLVLSALLILSSIYLLLMSLQYLGEAASAHHGTILAMRNLMITALIIGTRIIAVLLIGLAVWFRRQWLSWVALPLAALLIMPQLCVSLATLSGQDQSTQVAASTPSEAITPSPEWTVSPAHTSPYPPTAVLSARYSHDGKRIVTGSGDGNVRVWDASNGQLLQVITGHTAPVSDATWSPDDLQIISVSQDQSTRVWDGKTGKQVAVLPGRNSDKLGGISFSPDGKQVAIAGYDGTVRILSSADWKELLVLSGHGDRVSSAEYSPDGKHIVTASADRSARIWDATTGKQLVVLSGHTKAVLMAAHIRDGSQIITGSNDGTVRVWDAATGNELRKLVEHPGAFSNVVSSPDGNQVLLTVDWNEAELWDFVGGKRLALLGGDNAIIWSAGFSPDGRHILTGDQKGQIRVWEAATQRELLAFSVQQVASAQANATATVMTGNWRVQLSDWSSENPNHWPVGNYTISGPFAGRTQVARGSRQIVDGKYRWLTATSAVLEVRASPAAAPVSDFDLSVDAQQVSGSDNTQYGLVFRQTEPGTEYVFSIYSSVRYSLIRYDKGKEQQLILPTYSPAIKPGQLNRLRVVAVGSHFSLFVNDQLVAQANDNEIPQGNIGILVYAANEPPQTTFEFSNLELRTPK